MSLIEFRRVGFQIGPKVILRELNLTVEAGETLVLLGRSGSGKTTALRLINGMLFPTSGQVVVSERPTTEWDAVALKRSIGYVIQESGLFPHFTVGRNVGLQPELAGWPKEKIGERVRTLLRTVSLDPDEFLARYPRQLSGGQRQRVGVARALAADPGILLFDEPFGALDPVTRLDLQREFPRLVTELGKTAVFVTHDVREAMKLGTRIALLEAGCLVFAGTPGEFQMCGHPEARAFQEVFRDAG